MHSEKWMHKRIGFVNKNSYKSLPYLNTFFLTNLLFENCYGNVSKIEHFFQCSSKWKKNASSYKYSNAGKHSLVPHQVFISPYTCFFLLCRRVPFQIITYKNFIVKTEMYIKQNRVDKSILARTELFFDLRNIYLGIDFFVVYVQNTHRIYTFFCWIAKCRREKIEVLPLNNIFIWLLQLKWRKSSTKASENSVKCVCVVN